MFSDENESYLHERIFSDVPIGIVVVDALGRIVLINRFLLKEFEYAEEDLLGENIRKVFPDMEVNQLPSCTEVLSNQLAVVGNGINLAIDIRVSTLDYLNKDYYVLYVKEATIQESVEKLKQEYENKLADMLETLNRQKELNDLKSSFVSLASHEFKTPLSTILSSASLLSHYKLTEEQEKRDKHIVRIKSAVEHLNGILNEFLSIRRIEKGEQRPYYREIDIVDVVEDMKSDLRHILKPGQEIRFFHEGDAVILFDVDMLRTIILNLLSNAIRFSGENSVIAIDTMQNEEGLRISIVDEGCGIPEEDIPHIFELFYRGSNAKRTQGTGLGLHIVAKYVDLLKGTAEIKSEIDKGTEIILNFNR